MSTPALIPPSERLFICEYVQLHGVRTREFTRRTCCLLVFAQFARESCLQIAEPKQTLHVVTYEDRLLV